MHQPTKNECASPPVLVSDGSEENASGELSEKHHAYEESHLHVRQVEISSGAGGQKRH
jgi:hypothetical protein